MRTLVGKPVDLVLDRRAVARPLTGNLAAIHRRQMHRFGNDPVRFRRCAGDAAFNLRHVNPCGHGRKRHRRIVCRLHIKRRPVDRPPVKACRCACFQTAYRKIKRPQPRCQRVGWCLTDTARRGHLAAKMDQPAKKGAGCQHNSTGIKHFARLGDHTTALPVAYQQITNGRLDHPDTRLGDQRLDGLAVKGAVGLGAGPVNSGAARTVQHPGLYPGGIDGTSHDSVQRINLAHQMALAKPANGRIAGHLANPVSTHGHKRNAGTHARGCRGCLAAGMSTTNNDHIMNHAFASTALYALFRQIFPAIYHHPPRRTISGHSWSVIYQCKSWKRCCRASLRHQSPRSSCQDCRRHGADLLRQVRALCPDHD